MKMRLVVAAMYFALAYVAISFYGDRGYFYSPLATAGTGYASATNVILAIGCAVWCTVAGVVGALLANVAATKRRRILIVLAASTTITGLGLVFIPLCISREKGYLLLQNSWIRLSCLFVIGRFISIFPLIAAPLLTVATLISEWLMLRSKGSLEPHHI